MGNEIASGVLAFPHGGWGVQEPRTAVGDVSAVVGRVTGGTGLLAPYEGFLEAAGRAARSRRLLFPARVARSRVLAVGRPAAFAACMVKDTPRAGDVQAWRARGRLTARSARLVSVVPSAAAAKRRGICPLRSAVNGVGEAGVRPYARGSRLSRSESLASHLDLRMATLSNKMNT